MYEFIDSHKICINQLFLISLERIVTKKDCINDYFAQNKHNFTQSLMLLIM